MPTDTIAQSVFVLNGNANYDVSLSRQLAAAVQ